MLFSSFFSFFFFFRYKNWHSILQPAASCLPDWSSSESPRFRDLWAENPEGGKDKETEAGKRLQLLLIQGTGDLTAKCKIQVTIHTETIICAALCCRSMGHTANVGLLFGSHSECVREVFNLKYVRWKRRKQKQKRRATSIHCNPAGLENATVGRFLWLPALFSVETRGDNAPQSPATTGCRLELCLHKHSSRMETLW